MSQSAALIAVYAGIATALTLVIVDTARDGDEQMTNEVIDHIHELEGKLVAHEKNFCRLINQMHEIRGFEVLDCESGHVVIEETAIE